ncbi:hypothetical protein HY638_01780 [Candidatus Woesearchaeota archaeon]|nr:hypothetical protein [Candidatus Woesearchaeota archaeon]
MKKAVVFIESYSRNFPSSSPALAKLYHRLSESYSRYAQSKVLPLIRKLSGKYHLEVIAMDSESSMHLGNMPHRRGYDFIETEKIDEKSMEFVRNFMGSNELKALSYDGFSLWELEEVDIWEGFFCGFARRLEIVKKVIEKQKPELIVVLDRHSEIGKAAMCFSLPTEDYTPLISSSLHSARKKFLVAVLKHVYKARWPAYTGAGHTPSGGKKVVVLTDTSRIASSTLPWVPHLDRGIDLMVIGPEDGFPGLPFKPFSAYPSKQAEPEFSSLNKKSITYEGMQVYRPLAEMFDFLFHIGFPRSIRYIELCKSIIEAEKPKLGIVYGDRLNFGKVVCRVFSRHSIPTLIIQLGVINESPVFGPITATKMAVFGNHMKNMLVKHGNSPSRLIVTGQPRFDEIVKRMHKTGNSYKNPGKKKSILFISNKDNSILHAVISAAKKIPDAMLVIKLHPDENSKQIKLKSDATISHDPLYGLLNESSVVVASSSPIAWEALMLGKPLVMAGFTHGGIDCGAAINVHKEKDLLPAIRRGLHGGKNNLIKRCAFERTYKRYGNSVAK